MALTPPKCKTCGKAEWRHICMGPSTGPSLSDFKKAVAILDAAPVPAKGARILSHDITDPVQREALRKELEAIQPGKKRGRPIKPGPKSKRADYQRELMRKRYAEKKGKPNAP